MTEDTKSDLGKTSRDSGGLYISGPASSSGDSHGSTDDCEASGPPVEAVDTRRVRVRPEPRRDERRTPERRGDGKADLVEAYSPETLHEDLIALEAALLGSGAVGEEARRLYERVNDTLEDFYWIAHITATATSRAAKYSLWSGVRTGTRMVRAMGSARSFEEFVDRYEEIAVDEMERHEVRADGDGVRRGESRERGRVDPGSAEALRSRGEELLEMSADVDYDSDVHPAFSDILDQLAPDEARILRLLAMEGPQPSVNVRDGGWFPISTDLVAAGLSMVGTEAGLIHERRTQAYLNNLNRLGLVWFSDEPVEEIKRYQLVEAQPDVKQAIDSCKRAKVVRRSIHLTPFGLEFCRVCLPVEIRYEDASGVYDAPINRTERGGSKGQTRVKESDGGR